MTEREMNMLSAISNLRFLNTSQVHRLHGYEGKYGDVVTRKKLRELEQRGFLKSWQPSKYDQKVFYVSKKGAEEIKNFYGIEQVRLFKKSDKTVHQVMISEIYVTLRLEDRGRLKRFALSAKVGEIMCDAFVQFDVGRNSKLFFLEADRCTEGITMIKEKLDGYKAGFRSHWYQERFGIFPDTIFITTNESRKRSLLNLTNKYPFRIRVFTMDEFTSNPMVII